MNPRIPLLIAGLAAAPVSAAETFTNPVSEGADPWVVRHDDQYVWCQSAGDRAISVWISDRLTSLGTRHIVWRPDDGEMWSRQVWAPELHFLDGRWHIYFAASDGENANHLAYALRSEGDDPTGPYELHGPFATGGGDDGRSPNLWAIDMTVLEHDGQRYALWSGWDEPESDRQYLYIAPMKSPVELAGPRVLICENDDHLWERTEERPGSRGLNEGPQVLKHDGRTFVPYSCGASWLPTYKLGLLELTGDDPLDPESWKKFPDPVFRSTDRNFGTGHSCFVRSPDGSEWWHVFHGKRSREPGWQRAIFIQPFEFGGDGLPDFGRPVAPGTTLPVPSGQEATTPALPVESALKTGGEPPDFSYYGHRQFLDRRDDGTHLGVVPSEPVNDYRSGEKLVIRDGDWADIDASVTIQAPKNGRDAGLLFRVSQPSVGYDAQQGYFAGVIPRDNAAVLGRTDGENWTELEKATLDEPIGEETVLRVLARGPAIEVRVDGESVITAEDDTWSRASVGLRVVDTHARFTDLRIAAP